MKRVVAEWLTYGVRNPNSRITVYCRLNDFGVPDPGVLATGVLQHNSAHWPFILRANGLSYGGEHAERELIEPCSLGTTRLEPGAEFEHESVGEDGHPNGELSTYVVVTLEDV